MEEISKAENYKFSSKLIVSIQEANHKIWLQSTTIKEPFAEI